ncbi:hypothetical protein [Agromyces sp. Marseille-P2726]|uniref:hypothetical protein n=1 Tax=Agromyces sp. Marseille-P2726 TaxID=2709132 RepID=UPI00156D4480|nr:hypothetical protein [Agromyces sp. Marseille-P2726]
MDVILGVLLALLIIMAVSLATVFFVARAIARRVRRSRAIGGAVLRTRAGLSSGARGKVLRLRVRLHDSLDSGRAAVEVAGRGQAPRGDVDRLFRRIRHEGEALDLQLRLMESETDAAVLAEQLPAAGRRVDQVADLIHRLRAAVASGLGDVSDDALTTLHTDVEHEVVALHAGVQHLRTLNQRDHPDARPRIIRPTA